MVSHGWIADHTLFEPFIARIDGERFTYAFPDCRGYAARREEAGPWSMAAVAADAIAMADALGWARFHVVGHSMGGMVAQRLSIDVPERIASMVLLAPVPACGAQLPAERRTLLRRAVADAAARRDLIDANTGRWSSADWIDRVLALSLRTTREDAMLAYLESWSDTDFAREVKEAPVPVHVILGELDPGASIERMRQTVLRWYAGATCELMRGVGHYPMQERPDELHTLVSRCVGGAAGANESAIS